MEASRDRFVPGTGWMAFATVLFVILGTFHIIDGVVAITKDHHFAADLIVGNLTFWGFVILVIGAVQLLAAYLIARGAVAGQALGVIIASLSLLAQLFFVSAYPVWSVIMMVLDGLVIYGLTVYGEEYARSRF